MKNKDIKRIVFRLLKGIVLALCTISFIPILYLASILVFLPETFNGFLFGITVWTFCLSIILIPFSLYLKKRKKVLLSSLGGVFTTIILLFICYLLTPDRRNDDNSNARSLFSGEAEYQRASMANLVPEIDQLKLGTYVFTFLDPFIDESNSSRIRKIFLDVYREMRNDEEFNNLGSALNLCYLDIFTGNKPNGHLYEYIPDAEKPLPVILFVHGSLGNFKGYLWCWKKFADKNGYAVVAPTFGAGNWNQPGGVEEILNSIEYCKKNPMLDSGKIYIVGLSNGGKGVSRVILSSPQKLFEGVIYISAVMEDDVIMDNSFIDKCKTQNILVLHGNKDKRIPVKYIIPQVNNMKLRGVNVQESYYPEEDHFLMFSSWQRVQEDIEKWLEENKVVE